MRHLTKTLDRQADADGRTNAEHAAWVFRTLTAHGVPGGTIRALMGHDGKPRNLAEWSDYLSDNFAISIFFDIQTEDVKIFKQVKAKKLLLGEWKRPEKMMRMVDGSPVEELWYLRWSEP